jgi:hypothetical protein
MVGLRAKRDSARQAHDDTHGWVHDLLGKVQKERDLKLKAEDVSIGLAVEVARGKTKIHTLEIEVS